MRRALLLATAERHLGLAINFALVATVSRLLTPGEIGISVIGASVITLAVSLRQFVTPDFLIQRRQIDDGDVRTAFTLLFLCTALISATLFALSEWTAAAYGQHGLALYLRICAVAALLDCFTLPIVTLLRREMNFAPVATINTGSSFANAVVTLALAACGFSFMSFAWGVLAGSSVALVLALLYRPQPRLFLPSLKGWVEILHFGGCNGITIALDRAYDAMPQLLIGRLLPIASVGLYNRANMVCGIPDRIILGGVFSVALPALANEAHSGRSLAPAYLRALTFITVFHWPALVVLALLADPVVHLVLGSQWTAIIPLVQILCVASLFWFPVILTQPLLVALGKIHENVTYSLISRPVSAVILCGSSLFGLTALALSQLVALPFQMLVSFVFVRRHVEFRWRDVGAALWPSFLVTAASAAGPALLIAASGFRSELSPAMAVLAGLLALVGWILGVRLSAHPLKAEMDLVAAAVLGSVAESRLGRAAQRLREAPGRLAAPSQAKVRK
ncbi:oligosaccharide flippase family protein [Bosea sp. 117]|uniref:oligosaccharide flippase family protein n=1 Tax=Bosea sp. 117 TaxID=1125973 RepID=UPI0018CC2470|nr:oligosaccharide flippase family protein [Bosea sp. 117]